MKFLYQFPSALSGRFVYAEKPNTTTTTPNWEEKQKQVLAKIHGNPKIPCYFYDLKPGEDIQVASDRLRALDPKILQKFNEFKTNDHKHDYLKKNGYRLYFPKSAFKNNPAPKKERENLANKIEGPVKYAQWMLPVGKGTGHKGAVYISTLHNEKYEFTGMDAYNSEDIKYYNRIADSNSIRIGAKLLLPIAPKSKIKDLLKPPVLARNKPKPKVEPRNRPIPYSSKWDHRLVDLVTDENDGKKENDFFRAEIKPLLKGRTDLIDGNEAKGIDPARITLAAVIPDEVSDLKPDKDRVKSMAIGQTYIMFKMTPRAITRGKTKHTQYNAFVGYKNSKEKITFTHSMLFSPHKEGKAVERDVIIGRGESGEVSYNRDFARNYLSEGTCIRKNIKWVEHVSGLQGLGYMTTARIQLNGQIFMHGTATEDRLGYPSSAGCFRCANLDLVALFEAFNFKRGKSAVEVQY